MSIFSKRVAIANLDSTDDANLVMYSLGGDRDAFCQIVSRYQNLLCSVAYSSLGDIKHSEDVAQEAFVEAWKKLDSLQEPAKLKAWLCGILRFKVSHYRRSEQRQPQIADEELDQEKHQGEASRGMDEAVIDQQQQKLMWSVLNDMDETYREPLVLFYREQQSVEKVATELDLTIDTVKQRLSRGRKLLKLAMSSFVEESLQKSKPGVAFTVAVMTACSSIAPPAKAAVLGTGLAKTGSFFKFATILAFLAAFSGLISSFFGLRASLDVTRTERERRLTIKTVVLFLSIAAIFVVGMLGLKQLALNHQDYVFHFTVTSQLLVLAFVLSYIWLVIRMFEATRNLRAQERIFRPEAFSREVDQKGAKQREFKSRLSLFGVPLVHIQFGMLETDDKPAFGWIAGGSYAHGLLFAWGGVAIAPISVGIVSIGVITIGAVGIGLLSAGTVAIGAIAFGASAVGFKAYSSLSSLGWESAFSNGFSIAHDAALGYIAYAEQANNELAAEIVNLSFLSQNNHWVLATIVVAVIVPSIWHSVKVRQRMK